MNPNQFFEQIAQGQYEAFREYLNTGNNGGPATLLNLFKDVRVIPNLPAFLEHLFKAIKPITTLISLNLWGNNISPDGAAAIAHALETNTSLTTLTLYGTSIGPKGATAIAQALETNTTLTTLNLGLNNIGNDGAAAISQALEKNATLTTLELGLNNIGREGAATIAQALKTNTTLTTLDLRGNNIGNDGKTAILRQIPLESALTHLLFEWEGSFQNNTNDIIGTLQQEKEVLDIVYRQWPRPITEAFAQHFTLIKNETAQNLLIDPNNDISRGRAYVKHRSLAIKPAHEAASIATPASNDSQNTSQTFAPGKRNKEQDNSVKRPRTRYQNISKREADEINKEAKVFCGEIKDESEGKRRKLRARK